MTISSHVGHCFEGKADQSEDFVTDIDIMCVDVFFHISEAVTNAE